MRNSFCVLILITVIWSLSACQKKTVPLVIQGNSLNTASKSILEIARGHLGKPYVYGKTGPDSFDCSGFVYGVHQQVGIILPRTSYNQSRIQGAKVSRKDLQKGDLVFFDTSLKGKVNHSGIYLGDGNFIHASSGKAYSVTISSLNAWYKDKFKWGKRLNANK
ncbi:MAG: Invasion associated protein p60 [uncultured Sulfurovum sp.]|uniref:Invasion associated protein p60 n=1 Tax=uncultured Sulfurovum sp. TaxID=269237 RepID=A0A6S6TRX0_9BACT|nr:MAG: Invasion associated protein p60 [uncultured Sulfurovum sp.]